MSNVHVEVHHVTRVEGHGNILIDVAGGRLERCELEIIETPRFFEPMLRGRPYSEASHITSRICGICSVGHATTSLQATEAALGLVPSEQTRRLRQINFFGEILDSHILHTYMLDFEQEDADLLKDFHWRPEPVDEELVRMVEEAAEV